MGSSPVKIIQGFCGNNPLTIVPMCINSIKTVTCNKIPRERVQKCTEEEYYN